MTALSMYCVGWPAYSMSQRPDRKPCWPYGPFAARGTIRGFVRSGSGRTVESSQNSTAPSGHHVSGCDFCAAPAAGASPSAASITTLVATRLQDCLLMTLLSRLTPQLSHLVLKGNLRAA